MPKEEETKLCVYLDKAKKWRVTTDPFNFILAQKVTPKKAGQKPYYKIEGYYQNLRSLLEGLCNKKLLDSDAKTARALLEEFKQIHEDLQVYARVIIK